MGYDWDAHQQTCYRLYIEEGKALEDIMQHMRVKHKFTPSKRAFQSQFRKWNFPFKQKPAYKNALLVDRIRQLWEANQPQGEMLRLLHAEGFDIKSRELMRVRVRNRWLLRVPHRDGDLSASPPEHGAPAMEGDGGAAVGMGVGGAGMGVEMQGGYADLEQRFPVIYNDAVPAHHMDPVVHLQLPIVDPEAKLLERRKQLESESSDRWETKKRRRRTRDYAGLPADPPGPPRFPSETTLTESQRILKLDKEMYLSLRARFKEICEDANVVKKTLAGSEKWDVVKEQLVKESEHLTAVMAAPATTKKHEDIDDEGSDEEPAKVTLEAKKLALEVLCTDVTKRMRTTVKRLTIADAKNILGINPEQSRQVRADFYNILKNSHITMKLEAGIELWRELKQVWLDGSPLLQRILAPGPRQDPDHDEKVRAVEALARDVMKRLRDDQTRRKPTRTKPDAPAAPLLEVEDLDHDSPLDGDIAAAQAAAAAAAAAVGEYGSQMSLLPTTPNEQLQIQLQPSPGHLSDHHSPQLHHTRPNAGLLTPNVMDGGLIEQHQAAAAAAALLDSQLNSSMLLTPDAHAQASFEQQQQLLQQFGQTPMFTTHHHAQQVVPPPPSQQPPPAAIPVYIRLHPHSTFLGADPLWIETLRSARIAEIHEALEAKFPDSMCVQLEGVLKDSPAGGSTAGGRAAELSMQITSDEEFGAFVAGALGRGSPNPTLVVLLVWRGDPGFQGGL